MCKMQNGIIGITRSDQARDKFGVIWSERSRISQDTRSLLNQEDDEDEATFTRHDSFPSRMKRDVDDVKKLVKQLTRFDVFKERTTLAIGEDGENDNEATRIPLVSLAIKDIALCDIVRDLLTAEDRGKQHPVNDLKQRLTKNNVGFHDALRKHNSKTVADLYKTNISSKLNVQKTIKADRKLLQRLLNAVTSGQTVQMGDIVTHELSPILLSLAQPSGDMNTTTKAELIAVLTDGVDIPSEVPDADTKTCVLIDGHALIQSLGTRNGCQTFGDYADVFVQNATRHFREHTRRVDVVFDRYIGKSSNRAVTRSKRVSKKSPFVSSLTIKTSHFDWSGAISYHWMKTKPILPDSYLM